MLRGVGPARQSASLDTEHIYALELADEPLVEGGPTGPGRWAIVAIFWVLREIEIAAARDRLFEDPCGGGGDQTR